MLTYYVKIRVSVLIFARRVDCCNQYLHRNRIEMNEMPSKKECVDHYFQEDNMEKQLLGNVVIFGTGDNMIHSYKFISSMYNVVTFVDNNKNKQTFHIAGKPVIGAEEITKVNYDYIIVTPTLHQSICQQLLNHGIAREKILLLRDLVDYSQYKGNASVAFCLQGGLGDYLSAANYIWHLAKEILSPSCNIDIYCTSGTNYAHSVFDGSELVCHVYDTMLDNIEFSDYDLVVRLEPYPVIIHRDDYFLSRLLPKAVDYVLECERFQILYGQILCGNQFSVNRATVFQEIHECNWLKSPDVNGFLRISDEYQYPLSVLNSTTPGMLDDCDPWVTLCSLSNGNVRDWPKENWDFLREWLFKKYADRQIVDIVGKEDSEYVVDFIQSGNIIRSRLNLNELSIILQGSKLTVGTDSPLIHLRYALHGGPSIVLFGATSDRVRGCPGNLNLRGAGCKHWCEGVADNWEQRCLREQEGPPCMASITPEWVIEKVESFCKE